MKNNLEGANNNYRVFFPDFLSDLSKLSLIIYQIKKKQVSSESLYSCLLENLA